MSWYTKIFRKVHWDFDNPYFVKDIAKRFGVEKFIIALKEANVEAIDFFAKDVFGQFYIKINNKRAKLHPNLRRNFLEEILKACRANGIKIMFYYVALDTRIPKEWRRIGFNEKVKNISPEISPTFISPCFNSPYLEEFVIPEVEELAKYNPDGFFFDIISQTINNPCYSKYCREKFRKEFGREIPTQKNDPFWRIYLKWQRSVVDNFEKRISESIKRINSEILIGFNYSHTLRKPETPPPYLDYMTVDVVEGERTASNILSISQECRYLSTLNKPFDVMNTRFLYWWSDWRLKPSESLKQECATILANGGKCFIGDKLYPDGNLDKKVMEVIGGLFSFIKEREKYCNGAKPIPYIGILHSSSSYYNQLISSFNFNTVHAESLNSIRGAHKSLVESSFHFNILNEDTLLKDIFSYRTIILPEQNYLKKDIIKRLKEFVKNGGGLISSYKSGFFDEEGTLQEEIFELLGNKYEKEYPYSSGYIEAVNENLKEKIDNFPILVECKIIEVNPTTSQVLASLVNPLWENKEFIATPVGPKGEKSNYPYITLNQYGRGKVIFIAGEIFKTYWEKNDPYLKYLIRNLVNLVTSDKLLEVKAPPCLEVSLFQKENKKILHLVNSHTEKVLSGISFAEFIPPIYGIKVRLKIERKPKEIIQQPEKKRIEFTYKEGYIEFKVPEVKIHTAIEVIE